MAAIHRYPFKGGSMRIFYVGLIVIVCLFATTAWSVDWDPEKALDIKIGKVLEGSEEIKEDDTEPAGEVTTRGIHGFVVVVNNLSHHLFISRGKRGGNLLGIAAPGPAVVTPVPVNDSGDTKLWACRLFPPSKVGNKCWRKTVNGFHVSYRWTINP
jgi:hypothetical protein